MDVPACFGSRGHLPPQKRWLVLHRPHRHSAGQIHTVLTKTQSPGDTASRAVVFPWSPRLQGSSQYCGDAWQRGGETHQGSWSWNGCPYMQDLVPGGSLAVVRLCSALSWSHQAAASEMLWRCPSIPLSAGSAAQSQLL